MSDKERLYLWAGLHWVVNYDINGNPYYLALCPKQRCNCGLVKSKEKYSIGEYKYSCVKCDFKITLNKSIEEKSDEFEKIFESLRYKDAEIINIDGELIRVQREEQTDDDYWIDAKISKNKKGDVQLMILAGSRKTKDKTQLFLDPQNERLSFDQNNDHPTKVFSEVVAKFKNSSSIIQE